MGSKRSKPPHTAEADLQNLCVRGPKLDKWVELRVGQLVCSRRAFAGYTLDKRPGRAWTDNTGNVHYPSRSTRIEEHEPLLVLDIRPHSWKTWQTLADGTRTNKIETSAYHELVLQRVSDKFTFSIWTNTIRRPAFDLLSGTGAWIEEKLKKRSLQSRQQYDTMESRMVELDAVQTGADDPKRQDIHCLRQVD